MKTFRFILMIMSVTYISMTFQSCLDDDNNWDLRYPNALVTVKPINDNSFFLQLDDSTTLLPTNMKSLPFGNKETRALVNYSETNDQKEGYSKAVYINWIDSILTKPIAPDLGATKNDSIYGTDPVEIINDWVTIAEDGYLTLRFRTVYGNYSKSHLVNLITTSNPENPYEVEFRHNAYGDTYGVEGDGLVAFNLNTLPDTKGKTVKLKLKWKSFSGNKSTEFNYCTRKSTTPAKASITAQRSVLRLK